MMYLIFFHLVLTRFPLLHFIPAGLSTSWLLIKAFNRRVLLARNNATRTQKVPYLFPSSSGRRRKLAITVPSHFAQSQEVHYVFSMEDSRDAFNIPYDLRIYREVFSCERATQQNAFWKAYNIPKVCSTFALLVDNSDAITQVYSFFEGNALLQNNFVFEIVGRQSCASH